MISLNETETFCVFVKKETKEKEEEDVWIWKRANKQKNERTNVVGSGFWTTLQKDLSIKNWTCFRLKKWRPLLQSTAANLQKSWQVLASRHTWARSGHEKSTPSTGRFYLFRFNSFTTHKNSRFYCLVESIPIKLETIHPYSDTSPYKVIVINSKMQN